MVEDDIIFTYIVWRENGKWRAIIPRERTWFKLVPGGPCSHHVINGNRKD